MQTQLLSIDLGAHSYDIMIGQSLIEELNQYIGHLLPERRVIIVTDQNVANHCLHRVEESLKAHDITTHAIVIPAGESSKSFAGLEGLLDQIFELKPERRTVLIALGGGVIGDLTGFAASIVLRGIPFIQIPTTLLAQVDSSVGGKTGINNAYGKNLIGSFYQPRRVIADISLLKTLPQRQFLSGYAEVIKYGLIGDAAFFEWLEKHSANILARDPAALSHIVTTSCKAKATIVAKDEKEHGLRALLNLGHTFGHALEAFTGFSDQLLHGESIAIGMVMAARLSQALKLCDNQTVTRVIAHLQKVGLPVSLKEIQPHWDVEQLLTLMQQDKKVQEGKMVLILLRSIGHAVIEKDVSQHMIRQVLIDDLV